MTFVTRKIFDANDFISVNVKEIIELWDGSHNIIGWTVGEAGDCDVSKRVDVDLLANGAVVGEEVLIRLWW